MEPVYVTLAGLASTATPLSAKQGVLVMDSAARMGLVYVISAGGVLRAIFLTAHQAAQAMAFVRRI